MVSRTYFGSHRGREVYLLTLDNGILRVGLLSFGATIHSLVYKGVDVCLGYDKLGQYVHEDGYIGASVGRHANRIAKSRFELNGQEFRLCANEGENQLHGGKEGFSHRVWDFRPGEDQVTFSLDSPHKDQGFPGNLRVEITFRLEGSALRIEYSAVSDRDTVVNLTNHAYFNLGGQAGGTVYSHELQINAEKYTPCGPGTIPTGEISGVDGTALDFRQAVTLGSRLCDPRLEETKGLDHNFVLSGGKAAALYCPETGIGMDVETSMEGMQVYSAGFLTPRPGKDDAVYGQHHAVCLETQHFPDAVNHKNFPSPVLKAGEEFSHWTQFEFSAIS